jgi:hypothetical protein
MIDDESKNHSELVVYTNQQSVFFLHLMKSNLPPQAK